MIYLELSKDGFTLTVIHELESVVRIPAVGLICTVHIHSFYWKRYEKGNSLTLHPDNDEAVLTCCRT